jgi:hypothetical protein
VNHGTLNALLSVALGKSPALLDDPLEQGTGVAFVLVYADRAGTLAGWSGPDRLEWFPTANPGDRFEHLGDQRGCTGIVLTEGPTAELALHRALTAAGGIQTEIDSELR